MITRPVAKTVEFSEPVTEAERRGFLSELLWRLEAAMNQGPMWDEQIQEWKSLVKEAISPPSCVDISPILD